MSLLPLLTPLASLVLALGLAYLRLERFQYRRQIQDHARKNLESLRLGGLSRRHETADYVRQLLSFSGSKGHAGIMQFPKTWGKIYRLVFCSRIDRFISVIAVIISTIVVIIGSAHAVDRFRNLIAFFDEENIGTTLYLLMFFFIVSVFLVLYGAYIDYKARKLIDKNTEQTRIFLVQESANVNVSGQS